MFSLLMFMPIETSKSPEPSSLKRWPVLKKISFTITTNCKLDQMVWDLETQTCGKGKLQASGGHPCPVGPEESLPQLGEVGSMESEQAVLNPTNMSIVEDSGVGVSSLGYWLHQTTDFSTGMVCRWVGSDWEDTKNLQVSGHLCLPLRWKWVSGV